MGDMAMKNILVSVVALGALSACANVQYAAPQSVKTMQSISVPGAHTLGPYSQAIRAGDFVYLSGVIAFDAKAGKFAEAKIGPQTHQVFANMKAVLAAAGLGLDDVVKTTVFLKNPKDFAPMNVIYGEYFSTHKPARSSTPGVDWGRPDILIEIDAVAYATQR